MAARRVIFTGQSGIRIGSVLNNFISKVPRFVKERQKPLFLKTEDVMKNIYLKEHKLADSPTRWLGEILKLPTPALYDLWEKAFKSVLKTIKDEKNKNIFINLHACFYCHYTVEYLSLAKKKLIKRFRPDLFITLIDDIYDIHDRLRDRDQIFHPSYGGATEPVGAILELMRILDWRAKEIMMTRHFANELCVPHYVFAVKHSYDTLDKLIFENKPEFYISHPISEVRRLQKRGEKEKANQIIGAIHKLESKSSSEFVSFLPTTIDELRIQREERDKKTIYMPKLMSRWDLERYQNPINMLFIPPSKKKPDPLWEKESEHSRELHLLLKALSDHIEVQVSSRDHKLVEQSNFIFVYRPCFNGNVSAGVMKEIHYYTILTSMRSKKQNCFIYMPSEDQNKLKIKQLEEILKSKIENGKIAYDNGGSITLNPKEEYKLITAGDDIDKLTEVFKEVMENKSLAYVDERHGLESDKVQKAIIFRTQTVREYISDLNQYINAYKQAATVLWEDDNLSPEILVDKTIEYLRKNK